MPATCDTYGEETVSNEGADGLYMDLSELEFWAFLAIAIPGLFLPIGIVWWKGCATMPIALLSLVFWPGALILALRLQRPPSKPKLQGGRTG